LIEGFVRKAAGAGYAWFSILMTPRVSPSRRTVREQLLLEIQIRVLNDSLAATFQLSYQWMETGVSQQVYAALVS
jgi:hypothetical protein